MRVLAVIPDALLLADVSVFHGQAISSRNLQDEDQDHDNARRSSDRKLATFGCLARSETCKARQRKAK